MQQIRKLRWVRINNIYLFELTTHFFFSLSLSFFLERERERYTCEYIYIYVSLCVRVCMCLSALALDRQGIVIRTCSILRLLYLLQYSQPDIGSVTSICGVQLFAIFNFLV